ncbi:MAG TPA: phosphatidylglycerophosphatase A [Candidatus Limnocylindria bacterium]|nr:phosphatidylglycerophosphatase A [Candidatus Limnocylindria bacterium]
MFLGGFFGGWEWILVLAVILVLFGAKYLPPLAKGLMEGLSQFRKAADRDISELRDAMRANRVRPKSFSIRLFVAQGFGIGKVPFAPGTFGSFLGLAWFAMLVATGNFWAYLAGAIEGIAFSIWLCDDAEKIMGKKDPGSVVLDEIIAIPFCFLPWIVAERLHRGALPAESYFFEGKQLWLTLGLVALFRLFDIWKPWPVRQIQRLPGGWGVTVDDLFAAGYVALISVAFIV